MGGSLVEDVSTTGTPGFARMRQRGGHGDERSTARSGKIAGPVACRPDRGLELSYFLTTANLDTLDRQRCAPYPARLDGVSFKSRSLGVG
jgi:hypothetical protein